MASNSITNKTVSGSISIGSINQHAAQDNSEGIALVKEIITLLHSEKNVPADVRLETIESLEAIPWNDPPASKGRVRKAAESLAKYLPAAGELVLKITKLLNLLS
jgi:hypothetical protein